eukprot:766144-Hanusia_phi.AAC.1
MSIISPSDGSQLSRCMADSVLGQVHCSVPLGRVGYSSLPPPYLFSIGEGNKWVIYVTRTPVPTGLV